MDDRLGHARVDWDDIRTTLAGVATRVCELLRSGPDPTRPACGQWNVGETAVHLSHAWAGIPAMAARDLDRLREIAAARPRLRQTGSISRMARTFCSTVSLRKMLCSCDR